MKKFGLTGDFDATSVKISENFGWKFNEFLMNFQWDFERQEKGMLMHRCSRFRCL